MIVVLLSSDETRFFSYLDRNRWCCVIGLAVFSDQVDQAGTFIKTRFFSGEEGNGCRAGNRGTLQR